MPVDMSNAVKAPPRKAGSRTIKSAAIVTPVDTRTPNEKREEGLNGLAQLGQLICVGTGQMADAAALGMHFPPLAKATADLADDYESVAKPIDFLIQLGPFTALIAAAAPLVLQLLANHKVLDANALASQGVVSPEVLESRMRAQIAQVQAQALRDQMQAQAEALAAEAELNDFINAQNAEAKAA